MIPSTSQSRALSISAFLVLVKQIISAFNPSFAIALTHELIPTLSSSDIGRSFNKDHSSVLAAIARVEEWKVKDKDMNVLYQKLVLSLKKN